MSLAIWLFAPLIGLALSDQVQGMIFALLIFVVAWWMHSDMMKRMTRSLSDLGCYYEKSDIGRFSP